MDTLSPVQPPPEMLVVIGASFGGVEALLKLARELPQDLPVAYAVVLHIGMQRSILPELLVAAGARAVHARDGEPLRCGTLYVAPPDHHLVVDRDRLYLNRAARENHTRPAIDPLFRSAALAWGPAAVGVILTGNLDDGTAGLAAIKACGGIAIVQDPAEAVGPDMPASALANVEVDHCVPLANIAPLLVRLAALRRPAIRRDPPHQLLREHAAFNGDDSMDNLATISTPTQLTCPDCGGTLSELHDKSPLRYCCHTGHAYTARSLDGAQAVYTLISLHAGLRALKEREALLRRLASVASTLGDDAQARVGMQEADRVLKQAARIEELLGENPSSA